MNAIDFIRETARYMAECRPDIYEQEDAVDELSEAIDSLREGDNMVECISFSSFILMRIFEDGFEEFIFSRKITAMARSEDEEGVNAYTYDEDFGGLPYITDVMIDEDDEF